MANDLELALEDLINSVKSVENLHVVDEKLEPGARDFTLAFGLGPKSAKRNFGADRVTYMVAMEFTARKHDLVAIAVKLDEIEDSITDDPRRGGNAQTSFVGEEWIPEEELDREGVTFSNFVGVVIYES